MENWSKADMLDLTQFAKQIGLGQRQPFAKEKEQSELRFVANVCQLQIEVFIFRFAYRINL